PPGTGKDVTFSVFADTVHERDETVVFTIAADPTYTIGTAAASAKIIDDDKSTVSVTASNGAEGAAPTPVRFTFTRTSDDGKSDISVPYQIDTTIAKAATPGAAAADACPAPVDYQSPPGATLAAGILSGTFPITGTNGASAT